MPQRKVYLLQTLTLTLTTGRKRLAMITDGSRPIFISYDHVTATQIYSMLRELNR